MSIREQFRVGNTLEATGTNENLFFETARVKAPLISPSPNLSTASKVLTRRLESVASARERLQQLSSNVAN